jgi:peptidyl-prolyl cis-trans isomerase D
MLEALRQGATGWIAKILLMLLILSFAVWGIADVFTGFSRGSVAKVGAADITPDEYSRVLQNELNGLSQEYGKRISMEDARREGVDRFVLNKLIGQAALREHARSLNLGLSQDDVVTRLKNDSDFAGPDGKFSRQGFEDLLSALNLTEAKFLQLRKDDELRQQLSSAVLAATVTPKAIIDIQHNFNSETRTLEFFKIDAAKVTVPAPDDAKLKAYYEENKAQYMTPEYRKFSALVATIEDLKKEVTIPDDELKKTYEETKADYDKPEKRRIQQIAFKDKAAAEAAREALTKGGKNFMDVAKDAGAKETDVNLGMLAKSQMIDPKIADAAFKVERDAISEVIEGRFATVLLRVIEITKGEDSTFDSAKDKVRDKLATTKASVLIQERADLVEENRNADKTLKEIADILKLKFFDVPQADFDNKDAAGKTAIDIPSAQQILGTVFKTLPGSDAEAIQIGNDGYAWINVVSSEEPTQKPYDQIAADIKTAYMETEQRKLMKEYADKLVERVKAGEDFAKIAADAGGKPDKLEDIKRNMSPPGLTKEAVDVAFTLAPNGAASAETTDRATRNIIKIAKISAPSAPSKSEEEGIVKDLLRNLQNDTLIAYVSTLQDKLGVTINEKEVQRVTGADVAQP